MASRRGVSFDRAGLMRLDWQVGRSAELFGFVAAAAVAVSAVKWSHHLTV